jgi:hypothetical protein
MSLRLAVQSTGGLYVISDTLSAIRQRTYRQEVGYLAFAKELWRYKFVDAARLRAVLLSIQCRSRNPEEEIG